MRTLPKEDSGKMLWRAAERGDTPLLADLLRKNIDVDVTNLHGITALMRAAAAGKIQIVQLLLEHGADPNRSRNDGFTPLMLAAFFGHTDIVKILVQHGADTAAAARSGTSASMWAAARTCKDVLDYLQKPDQPIRSVRCQTPSDTQWGMPSVGPSVTVIPQPQLFRSRLIVVCTLFILAAIGVAATGLTLLEGVPKESHSSVSELPRNVKNESPQREVISPRAHESQKTDSNNKEGHIKPNTQLIPLRRKVNVNHRPVKELKEQSKRTESRLTPKPLRTDIGIMATHIVPVKPVAKPAKLMAPPTAQLINSARSSSKSGKVIAWP